MAPVALTDAVPLTAVDGVTGQNSGRDIRKWIAGLLLPDVKSANPLAARNGVLPHNWDSAGCTSLRVQQQTTAAWALDVLAGPYVCERAGQGPYVGWSESTATVVPTTSNPTNPRIDIVYTWVGDRASITTDATHGPIADVIAGTPAASPSPNTAALPDGAVQLAQVRINAGSTTITSANITDMRPSTALTGAVRHMLPGDAINDPGRIDGELRYRTAVSPYPALVDYWDAAQSRWRGTQGATFTGQWPGTPDAQSHVFGTVSGGGNVIISVTIPDPGFPYRVWASSIFTITSIISPTTMNYYVSVNSGPFAGAVTLVGQGGDNRCPIMPIGSSIFTGSSTVRLIFDVLGGGSVGWSADVRNPLTIGVTPA